MGLVIDGNSFIGDEKDLFGAAKIVSNEANGFLPQLFALCGIEIQFIPLEAIGKANEIKIEIGMEPIVVAQGKAIGPPNTVVIVGQGADGFVHAGRGQDIVLDVHADVETSRKCRS